jgi:hypothetical protein
MACVRLFGKADQFAGQVATTETNQHRSRESEYSTLDPSFGHRRDRRHPGKARTVSTSSSMNLNTRGRRSGVGKH